MARPTKLTPAAEKIILDWLRLGATRTAAFEAAGIHRSKLSVYLRRYATFRDAVMRAEADAENRAAAEIRTAISKGGWRAAAWWLERRRADDWGKVDKVEIEIRRAAERIAAETGADPDWLIRRAEEIAASTARDDQ